MMKHKSNYCKFRLILISAYNLKTQQYYFILGLFTWEPLIEKSFK